MATHLIKKVVIFTVLWSGLAVLGACTSIPVSTFNEPLGQPEDARPAPIRFSGIKNQLPVGTEIGVLRPTIYRPLSLFSKVKLGRNAFNGLKKKDLERALAEMLEMQGYDITDSLDAFLPDEEDDEYMRAEYTLGAKLVGAKIDVRHIGWMGNVISDGIFTDAQGISGRLSIEVEWGLYDMLRRTTVYKTKTKGYVDQGWGNEDGVLYLFNEAFAMAAHNLGVDKEFHDLVFYGKKPDNEWRKKKSDSNERRPRKFNAQGEVTVKNAPLWKAHNQDQVRQAAKNAVVIQAGKGHGSGFFITKEGHILTNAHVVGDALRVRIVTSHKEEKLVAEVLRSNKARDVALLRLEEIPDDFKITPVPIQVVWPAVSEDIYSVGAPAHYRMQDTVTKGIVSAHRLLKIDGITMNFIQGDVQTIGGNSGGPLLDAYGNVVGMSVMGLHQFATESDSGLNIFIPISEALHYLEIDLVQSP